MLYKTNIHNTASLEQLQLTALSFFPHSLSRASGTRASWKPALCRTWSRTGQSRPCRTTSSSSTSSSKSLNNLGWICGDGGTAKQGRASVYVCVCVYMYMACLCVCERVREKAGRLLASSSTISLRKTWAELTWGIGQIKLCDGQSEDVIWHFLPRLKPRVGRKKKKKENGKKSTMIMSMIEQISVYSHRTMLSKWGYRSDTVQANVCVCVREVFFCSQSTVVFTNTSLVSAQRLFMGVTWSIRTHLSSNTLII